MIRVGPPPVGEIHAAPRNPPAVALRIRCMRSRPGAPSFTYFPNPYHLSLVLRPLQRNAAATIRAVSAIAASRSATGAFDPVK